MSDDSRRPTASAMLLLAVGLVQAAALTGCGESGDPPPKTYKVTGKVVYADGSPMKGGTIEFHSVENSGLTTMSQIKDDGTFNLTTITEKEKLSGAVEGTYTVTITTGFGQDQTQQEAFAPINVPKKYVVKPSDSNNFTIKIPGR